MGKKYIIELLDECNSEFKGIMVFGLTQEKQISVELIPEESLRPYTEPDTESIRKEAYDKGYTDAAYNCHERCAFLDDAKKESYQRGYETAKHECEDCNANAVKTVDDKAHEAYKKGLSDAWDAARKICTNWVLSDSVLSEIFGMDKTIDDIMKESTASEAIEKIRQYEQEKEEFHVGDEFENGSGKRFVILKMDGAEIDRYTDEEGKTYCMSQKYKVMRKTGRHFPEIATVLQKMKEAK